MQFLTLGLNSNRTCYIYYFFFGETSLTHLTFLWILPLKPCNLSLPFNKISLYICHLSTLHFCDNFIVKYRIHLKMQVSCISKTQLRFLCKEKLCQNFRVPSTKVILYWQKFFAHLKFIFTKIFTWYLTVFTFRVRIYSIVFKMSLSIAVRELPTKKQISPVPLLSTDLPFSEQTQEGAFRWCCITLNAAL